MTVSIAYIIACKNIDNPTGATVTQTPYHCMSAGAFPRVRPTLRSTRVFRILVDRWPCDSECLRFRQRLNEFPPGKQRAFIYYLAQKKTIHKLNISLHYLDANFNDRSVQIGLQQFSR